MLDRLLELSDVDLRSLASTLRSGRLQGPYSDVAVQRCIGSEASESIAAELQGLANNGFAPAQLSVILEAVLSDRAKRVTADEVIDLVTTGPEAPGTTNRDTSVVVRELFTSAERSVTVAGFAVYQGQHVFRALAERIAAIPSLRVRLLLDISRGPGDTSAPSELVARYVTQFKLRQWPQDNPLPAIYYDPRSLLPSSQPRGVLHAKCVIVDTKTVFISSANFTEAAHERNIEVGLLVRAANLATQLERHFDSLIQAQLLARAM